MENPFISNINRGVAIKNIKTNLRKGEISATKYKTEISWYNKNRGSKRLIKVN